MSVYIYHIQEYDYEHDDKLNPHLLEEYRQTVEIWKALQILDLQDDQYEKQRFNWGLGSHQPFFYLYVIMQLLIQILMVYTGQERTTLLVYEGMEYCFGVYFCCVFLWQCVAYSRFISRTYVGLDEQGVDTVPERHQEQVIRLYTLIILLIGGPIATAIDTYTLTNTEDDIQYGPCARVTVILAIQCLQQAIFKFIEVLPGVISIYIYIYILYQVSHIILFVAGILFSCALIGHEFLHDLDSQIQIPTFGTMTETYLFLLQVITFDGWGDTARIVINNVFSYAILLERSHLRTLLPLPDNIRWVLPAEHACGYYGHNDSTEDAGALREVAHSLAEGK